MEMKKNIPVCKLENVRVYHVEKINLSNNDFFKLETKLIVNVNEEDMLLNDIRKALFIVKPELLKANFKGFKPSDLQNQNYDIIIEFKPLTRIIKTQNGSFDKTEWYPEITNIVFAGDTFNDAEDNNKVPDEVL